MASETIANGTLANDKASKKRKHRAEQDGVADGESKKPSREERREAKRLKKLEKEDALPTKAGGEAAVVEDVIDIDFETAKLKRKEEKKKIKEEKALQSQKVAESEAAGALTANGDVSMADADERGEMSEDRMQMIEKAEARDNGTVEGKKITRTEKNARNKQKKKAKKAERIQAAESAKPAPSDSKGDVTAGSKEKEPSHVEDFVSIQPSEKSGKEEVSLNTLYLDVTLQAHIRRMHSRKRLAVFGKSGNNLRKRGGELHEKLHEKQSLRKTLKKSLSPRKSLLMRT